MTTGLTVKRQFQVRRGRNGHRKTQNGRTTTFSAKRVQRVSRLMALAIRFEQLIRDGVVADQAELARLGCVSRARLTQIMNLLNLAPSIQEVILFLPGVANGRDAIVERQLRPIAAESNWRKQYQLWSRFTP